MRVLAAIGLMFQVVVVYGVEFSALDDGLPFPRDVSFGMSSLDLQKARPMARIREHLGEVGMFGAIENVTNNNGVMANYIYHFKGGKLGAVIYNRASTNMLADVETKRIYAKLLSSGAASETMRTARAGQVTTVKQWKDARSKVDVCLEATTRGTTVTFYSPSAFTVGDLFPNASEKDKQLTILQKKGNHFSNSDNKKVPPIDRLSSDAPVQCVLVGE